MTLNGRYAFYCRKDTSFGAHYKICMKIHQYCQRQKCSSIATVSGCMIFMRIFSGVPWLGASKVSVVVEDCIFQCFRCLFFSGTLEMRTALLYRGTQSVLGFSVIPKCVTLNAYFVLNSAFAPVCLPSDRVTFENNCVKTNKDRPILSAAQIFGRDSGF